MATKGRLILFTVVLCISLGIARSEKLFAKDKKLKPEEVVAAHLKSIGSPKALEAIKSRVIMGTASVVFTQGAFGNLPDGKSLIVSEGRKLGIVMTYGAHDYPGEYFASDGDHVTVGYIDFDIRSKLGEFIRQYYGLMSEGLLGGTLSVAWPLLDVQKRRAKPTCKKRVIEGRQLHELNYNPKSRSGMEGLLIGLFFDLETFRHVMTEYRYRTLEGYNVTVLKERFDDFREVDGMMLPHTYTIDYSRTGPTFIGCWTVKVKQWLHNAPIDPQLFKAQSLRKTN